MESFFAPSLEGIVKAIERQKKASLRPIKVSDPFTKVIASISSSCSRNRLFSLSAGLQQAHGSLQSFKKDSSCSTSSYISPIRRRKCPIKPLAQPTHHSRMPSRSNKAVAEGAVSFHLDHNVTARVMRMTYGVICNIDYVESNPEHVARKLMKIGRPSGRVVLPNAFSSILNKVHLMEQSIFQADNGSRER